MPVDFALPPDIEEVRLKVRKFMEEEVKPVQDGLRRQRRRPREVRRRDREAARPRAGARPLEPPPARRVRRHGPGRDGDGVRVGGGGARRRLRPVHPERAGARRRQHAHALPLGDARPGGALPAPARRRQDPLVLRDDRAGGVGLRPDADPDARGEGRRRLGDQRPQVVHLRREGREVRDPDRSHRPGRRPAAGAQLRVPRRHSVRGLGDRARHRHDGRAGQPLRDPHHRPARARRQHAGRSRAGPPARPVPPRPGAAGALHALDRPGGGRARDDGRPGAEALRARLATSPTSRRSSG